MKSVEFLLGGASGFFLTFFLLPAFVKLLQEGGATRSNYLGNQIPTGIGIVLIPAYFLTALLMFNFFPEKLLTPFLLGIVFFGFLGVVDDLLGSRSSRGLRGHFGSLFRGILTTGAFKALGGGLGALLIAVVSFPLRPWWEILAGALLMALSANTINLFDLRPGRAIKVFFLWFLILLGAVRGGGPLILLFPLAGGLLACAPYDFRGKGMLGDVGANLLGIALGMVTGWSLSFSAQLAVLGFLVFLHFLTERYSLTEVIDQNRFLRFLDRLGRADLE